jgi:hypothetical protein
MLKFKLSITFLPGLFSQKEKQKFVISAQVSQLVDVSVHAIMTGTDGVCSIIFPKIVSQFFSSSPHFMELFQSTAELHYNILGYYVSSFTTFICENYYVLCSLY